MRTVRFEDTALLDNASTPSAVTRLQWDASAGDLVATMLQRWHLAAGEPYTGGESGAVLRVTTSEGRPAVLKVGFPHWEGSWEAVALDSWGERFAPEVMRQDAWTWALLLERIEPGGPLSRYRGPVDRALEIAARLFFEAVVTRRPQELPPGIPTLAEVVSRYVADATGRLADQHEVLESWGGSHSLERIFADTMELADSDRRSVMLHGDLNPGNIIQRGQQWVLIDPKPMMGDPEFDLFPLVEQLGSPLLTPGPARVLARRLDRVSALVGCDTARAARWCVARAALNVSWLINDGNLSAAHAGMRQLSVWREVSGT